MPAWLLFIDESGNFADPDDDVVVGGWLVRAYDTDQLRAALRQRLDVSLPTIPFPPHAAHLDVAVSRAFLQGSIGGDASCEDALQALSRATAEIAAVVRNARENRRVPSVADLRKADVWLRRNYPRLWRELAERRDREEHQRLTLNAALSLAANARESFAVAAFDRAGRSRRNDRERYEGLLRACVERVALHIAPRGSFSFVHLRVAERDLNDGTTTRRLDVPRVEHILRSAEPMFESSDARALVRSVGPFDATTHPGVVIADHLVNRFRRIARRASSWRELAVEFEIATRMAIEGGCGRLDGAQLLPAATDDGPAHAAVLAAMSDNAKHRGNPEQSGWVAEQAAAWISAAEGWRR